MKNYIDLKEFRDKGYLQEVNRLFFHPLGMAMVIKKDENGIETIAGVIDCRTDPEGFIFSDKIVVNKKEFLDKIENISKEFEKAKENRNNKLGYFIQGE